MFPLPLQSWLCKTSNKRNEPPPAANLLSASFYTERHKLRLNFEGKLTRQLNRGLGLTEIQVLLTLFRLLRAVSSKVNHEVLKIICLYVQKLRNE